MFEAAEIGSKLSKAEFKEREPELRQAVEKEPVIMLITGDDRPGCDDVINLLNEWLDPRYVETNAFGPMSDEELERPLFWRFWSQAAMRKGNWKYLYLSDGREWLFDLASKEHEKVNRIAEHPELAQGLKTELENWTKTVQ